MFLTDSRKLTANLGGSSINSEEVNDKEVLETYRHSVSHIMAHAIKELYPGTKFAIGPAIADGFYYDIDSEHTITEDDLKVIEKKMKEIIKAKNPFVQKELPKEEALKLFSEMGEIYKVELINELDEKSITIYEEGDFVDLCRGPHLEHTKRVKAFKLLSVAGAYWRGDEKNKMLQRIYGTAFLTKDDLKKHLDFLEEVKKRDHRRLGKELDLFSLNEDIGPGLVLWHPRGAAIRRIIENFWTDEHVKAGYQILYTPHMAKLDLWKKTGHLDFYKENMYSPMEVEGQDYEIKPMNCPFHVAIFKSHLRSYRELPLRYAELGTVYRYERSGVLHGLLRVRGFTQDDAHIFCREDQIEEEVLKVLDFTLFVLKTFGFSEYDIYLSTRPDKFVGSEEGWKKSTDALEKALKSKNLKYEVDPGEGVFYGPKIDIKVRDTLGRQWQCSTIQVDFNIPERLDIEYRGADSQEHRPIMIHRALMGSLERFFGVLIEHYAGAFPLWLTPVQVTVLPISDKHTDYAQGIMDTLLKDGIRVDIDASNEKMGYKVRKATLLKTPYMCIIGDSEVTNNTINIRKKDGTSIGEMPLDQFAALLKDEILNRR
ncbi:MAG TPA: threonine--tRNA ligase [Nitrospirae bacterium]|nr:threonine--tRNA ligase [Nitrospirota bacterium]HDO67278.1 threonine--tRNA ligase [Nitrospirota bacterium]HDZ83678.1 threonine--tRNA ligase [Nitrospirota bacterium]HEW81452.1 threonine--tRNA ligase [Nitrospirota bacterium]